MDSVLRLTAIEIQNFKNVEYGKLDFNDLKRPASIVGLYGQNGSGKSAVIDVLEIFSCIIRGIKIPSKFADMINVEADCSHLKYFFEVKSVKHTYHYDASYEFDLGRLFPDADSMNGEICRPAVSNERLKFAFDSKDLKIRSSDFINTDTDKIFIPVSNLQSMVDFSNQKEVMDLYVAKRMAFLDSRSFVFSSELRKNLQKNKDNIENEKANVGISLLERISEFGNFEFFIFNSEASGYVNLNYLPVLFRFSENTKEEAARIMIDMNGPTLLCNEYLDTVKKVISSMDIVLSELVPRLSVSVKELGMETMKGGKTGTRIELMTERDSKVIPLRYESDGIKKIISILELLIVVFNNHSITVAVDELDSGIFEYLLGEMLRIISEQGKGQLVFTSHNLRPLETIDTRSIVFTTTNPKNRYVRMKYVKANNNLRDFYYRDIVVGTQEEELYDYTDNAKIALAFRKAGVSCGA